ARAGLPGSAGALRDLLHELVAVHRLALEQVQDRVADVAATGAASGPLTLAGVLTRARRAGRARAPGAAALGAEDQAEQAGGAEDLVWVGAEAAEAARAVLSIVHDDKTVTICLDMSTS